MPVGYGLGDLTSLPVIPAKAGIQGLQRDATDAARYDRCLVTAGIWACFINGAWLQPLGPGLRRGDGLEWQLRVMSPPSVP